MYKLNVNNLSFSINGIDILKNISFSCNSGEIIAIIGKNGIGKTTLLKNILNRINIDDTVKFSSPSINIGYVPQFRQLDEELPLSAKDFISLPIKQKIIPWLSKKEKQLLDHTMKMTDVSSLSNKNIGSLSGGEKQRVFLTQALINDPKLLLLDEFTSNLDKHSEIHCMELIREVTTKKNIITLCITHEASLIDSKYIDKILYLSEDGYKFIDVTDFKKEESVFSLCTHCACGDNHV